MDRTARAGRNADLAPRSWWPQHANVELRVVAEAVTATAPGQPIPAALKDHLAAAVQMRQTGREQQSPG
ncbi:uncharacterized protein YcbX [Streptomyces pseudovenezuelae]|uniref:Uncharacterized protein YcbX n=1 Tax=Streptomyces pseudovenezuelae TaxID=67350 RepID=A0ABT6M0K5_9ACTN|nr:uncharacterized protein YcbX [Streptomyces pseudovenezuelae]